MPLLRRMSFTLAGMLALTTISYAGDSSASIPATRVLAHEAFEDRIRSDIKSLAGQEVVGLKVLHLSADVGPWMDTGLYLQPGDRVTMLLNGRMWLSRSLGLWNPTPLAVWAKQGDGGSMFHGTRSTHTFVAAPDAGSLRLKLYPSEKWLDASGRYAGEPAPVDPDAGGGIGVALIKWAGNADIEGALEKLAGREPAVAWASAELDRQKNQKMPPSGWNYIWELAPSEIFYEASAPSGKNAPPRAIELHMHDDVNILEKAAPFDLAPGTKLSWKWKINRLPSAVAENSIPTHDYISIAVKFDNGRDLTFFWSRDMPVDASFPCPLPGWVDRETHVVARSGTADLDKWISEEKNVFDYYEKSVGGPLPKKITHVWLIGVSFLQHGEGLGQFGEIKLSDGGNEIDLY